MRDWLKAFLNLGKISRILLDRSARILHTQEQTMSAATDIKTSLDALNLKVDEVLARLKAGQASPEDTQALVDAAATIQAISDKLTAA